MRAARERNPTGWANTVTDDVQLVPNSGELVNKTERMEEIKNGEALISSQLPRHVDKCTAARRTGAEGKPFRPRLCEARKLVAFGAPAGHTYSVVRCPPTSRPDPPRRR